MFGDIVKAILEMLKSNEAFAQSSFIYNVNAIEHNAYEGIPDPKAHKTFAHIKTPIKDDAWSNTNDDCVFRIENDFTIVCGINCLNAESVISSIVYQLNSVVIQFGATIKMKGSSDDSFTIYKEETGSDLKDKDLKLVRLKFNIYKTHSTSNCNTITCEEGCC